MFGVIYCDITEINKRKNEFVVCKACGGISPLLGIDTSDPKLATSKWYQCEDCGATATTTTITPSENSCGRTNEANEEKADESKCWADIKRNMLADALKEKDFHGMSEADAILVLVNEYSWPYSEAVDFVRFHLSRD